MKRLWSTLPLLGLLLLPVAPAAGQTATLVVDLNTQENDWGQASSMPRQLVSAGGRIFFEASTYDSGREVWVTDGTATGTEMLADACPGSCSADPAILGSAAGLVFWAATSEDRSGPRVLWRSDGTRQGTFPLTGPDFTVAIGTETPAAFLGGSLFFRACMQGGCEVWTSDGTLAGTRQVKDIVPGEYGSNPRWLTAVGGRLLFFADNPATFHNALWVSDGTAAGTLIVKEVDDFYPSAQVVAGGKLFFTARTDDGHELWVSDGTAAGTGPVTDFVPESPFPRNWLKAIGNRVYFVVDDVANGYEIWRSDGTAAGTVRVTEFGFYRPFESLQPWQLEVAGGRLVYVASDGISGSRLWATGATPASTAQLCAECETGDSRLVAVGGRIVFVARRQYYSWQLWSTDGTAAGTGIVPGLCAGGCQGDLAVPVTAAGAVWFIGPDLQVWRSDGTAAGTRRFTDLPGEEPELPTSVPQIAALGQRVYFPAKAGGYGEELWVSDGKPGGTRLVTDIAQGPPSAQPTWLSPLGDRVLFTACQGPKPDIWQSAGSAESTTRVTSMAQSFSTCIVSDGPQDLASFGGHVYFWTEVSYGDAELWRTDGTPGGTLQLTHFTERLLYRSRLHSLRGQPVFLIEKDIWDGPDVTEIWKTDGTVVGTGKLLDLDPELFISSIHGLGDELYFVANTSEHPFQVWRTDGTPAGTRRLLAGNYDFGEPIRFARAGTRVVFFGPGSYSSATGQLWKTDGTPEGTDYVTDLPLSPSSGQEPSEPVNFQGAAYFFAVNREDRRRALWRTDGTGLGTKVLRELQPEPTGSLELPPQELVAAGGLLFFRADDGVHGQELWRTDGTPQGTVLVRDISPGPSSSRPTWLRAAGGRLFFSAHDGVHGYELWQSDGTAAGTRLVQDIAPGAGSSHPAEMTAAGGRLYFAAHDGYTGQELWSLPLSGPAGCQPAPAHLCLGNGRFRVEARWRDFQGRRGQGTAVALTNETGYFWFFGPENVEVVVKVLDGQGVNGHHWVFYGALSSVEYALAVTDTQTGATSRYTNLSGQLASVGDTTGFGPLGAKSSERVAPPSPPALTTERFEPAAATGSCQATAKRLCLNGGRFAVEASWKAQGQSGAGTALSLTGDTGYFWFFGAGNVEVVIKVLDGTGLNGKRWVFYGALSDVEYTLTVTDTATGKVKTYTNPAGRMASVADTAAF